MKKVSVVLFRDRDAWPNGEFALTPGVAEGAIANGSRVEKHRSEPGDGHADGALGTVRASHDVSGVEGVKFAYFVEWDDAPGLPVRELS